MLGLLNQSCTFYKILGRTLKNEAELSNPQTIQCRAVKSKKLIRSTLGGNGFEQNATLQIIIANKSFKVGSICKYCDSYYEVVSSDDWVEADGNVFGGNHYLVDKKI